MSHLETEENYINEELKHLCQMLNIIPLSQDYLCLKITLREVYRKGALDALENWGT